VTALCPPHRPPNPNLAAEFFLVMGQNLVFGVVFGWVVGIVTRLMLTLTYNDRYIEASIIIGMSYLSFFLCEQILEASAVLSVVTMGLYLNAWRWRPL